MPFNLLFSDRDKDNNYFFFFCVYLFLLFSRLRLMGKDTRNKERWNHTHDIHFILGIFCALYMKKDGFLSRPSKCKHGKLWSKWKRIKGLLSFSPFRVGFHSFMHLWAAKKATTTQNTTASVIYFYPIDLFLLAIIHSHGHNIISASWAAATARRNPD